MKNYRILLGATFILLSILTACEKEDQGMDDPGSSHDEMTSSYDNTMIMRWDNAISIAIDNKIPTAPESRAYAIVTLAMHDALNNVFPKYETYALSNSARSKTIWSNDQFAEIADAAVARAAHDALIEVAPQWKTQADSLLDLYHSEMGYDGSTGVTELAKSGFEIGREAASAILTLRKNDIHAGFYAYDQGDSPGEYRSTLPFSRPNPPVWPENAAYAPEWGKNVPFGLESADKFRPEFPEEGILAPFYANDYKEVYRLGCHDCPDRTKEQTEMGVFFIENSPGAINRIARTLAVNENLNGFETGRLLALSHMVQADAHISAFEAKFTYNLWRPITGINMGDTDGNDLTVGDKNWTIPALPGMRPTPPVPAFPSSHAANGGAAAELFKLFFRTDEIVFYTQSLTLPNVTRTYNSFSQYAQDISDSRIYVGYQFRTSVEAGEMMGRQIADNIYKNKLRLMP